MRQIIKAVVVLVAAVSCGFSAVAYAQAPTCNQTQTPGCLYFPVDQFSVPPLTTSRVTYTDSAGLLRTIEFAIRKPAGAPVPMPVVIWSHGGAHGQTHSRNAMAEWSEVTAAAGYLTISIAHAPRSDPQWTQLCQSIGVPDSNCEFFKHLNWDRPFDIRAVIDELERMNRQGELSGQIAVNRIAVGGQSAGAGGTLSVAGALRNFTGTAVSFADPRPVAFLAFSPQQPGSEGFFDTDFRQPQHSWVPIRRPVLIGTGDGDNTCNPTEMPGTCLGDLPFGRRLNFDRMSAGNKYRIYLHDTDAFHMLFALSKDECIERGVGQTKCEEMISWLESAALAFLDAHVRQNAFARQWLRSNNVGIASGGIAEWSRK